jgi:DNA-binding response OmpR family regulator
MHKILIVEDEPAMQMGLKDNLEFDGYEVDVASDGPGGLEKIMTSDFDLVLLDVMLPGMSGFEVCKRVRSKGKSTPIILLTARGEEIDRVLGLELGADDYVTKPFSVRELLARIKAILRRSGDHPSESKNDHVKLGKLDIDFLNFQASSDGQDVKMSHKEFEVLKYLYENRNELVSRYDLLENVWGYNDSITTRTVDNFILRIRQKIEKDPANPQIILTVHGSGYRMIHH